MTEHVDNCICDICKLIRAGERIAHKLRRSVGEDRYPGMTAEVTASETDATSVTDSIDVAPPCDATEETASKPAKDYPPWFGAPTLIDRIDESMERGTGLSMAIAECAQWAELRSEVVQQLRDYYQSKTKGDDHGK
jgi:hypothetical protein